MNSKKWRECRSVSRLTIKLAEETGEVAKAYLDVVEASTEILRRRALTHLRTEVEHVTFIADCLDNLVIASGDPANEVSVL